MNYAKLSDDDLFECISNKDESALNYVYDKYFKMVLKYILKNSGTEDDAYETYNQAILIFWDNTIDGKLTLTSKISTYIYSVASNVWLKELVKRKRKKHFSINNDIPIPDISDNDDDDLINNKLLNKYISKLNAVDQKVIKYYYYDGLPMEDVAKKLNFSNANTAKTKKYKVKAKLKKLICNNHKKEDFYLI